jgi:hypothetical protein
MSIGLQAKHLRSLTVLLTLGLVQCTKQEARKTDSVSKPGPTRVVLLTDLQGVLEPCGCTSKPLGGLERLANQIELWQTLGPTVLIVVGDTFYPSEKIAAHAVEQADAVADTVAKILGRLSPLAIVLGKHDWLHHREKIEVLSRQYALPIFKNTRQSPTGALADSVMHKVGGLLVAMVGVSGDASKYAGAYAQTSKAMWAQNADIVLGLAGLSGSESQEFANDAGRFTIFVGGGVAKPVAPRLVRSVLWVEPGQKGQNVGVLELRAKGQRPERPQRRAWVFDHQHKQKRESLRSRIGSLESAIESLPAGSARQVRQKKLDGLRQDMASIPDTQPQQSSIRWSLHDIDKSIAPAAWAQSLLAEHNRSLCTISMQATADRMCPKAMVENDIYLGNQACVGCHPDDAAVYRQTAHAKAWDTLTLRGKQCDLGCVGCHSVGFEQAGGYCRLADAEKNRHVGCESCHGPGGLHSKAPFEPAKWGERFVGKPGESVCVGCHNEEHSDQFDWQRYLPKILGPGHGLPMETK